MSDYPEYIQQMLARAYAILEEDAYSQADVIAICFDILTLIHDCKPALELLLKSINDPWMIREHRKAIRRLIDEWDDRPWQQRRRLALSFGYLSQWEPLHFEVDDEYPPEITDVQAWLEMGDGQLNQAYLGGVDRAAEIAWVMFQEAIRRATHPLFVMSWVANNYMHRGFFGDAVEVLETALSQFPDEKQLRRWSTEVRWWCDNQHRIPWIPPPGDGSRYRRYMTKHNPERLEFENAPGEALFDHIPPDLSKLPSDFSLPIALFDDFASQVEMIAKQVPSIPQETSVDWTYLDRLEIEAIDPGQFPDWAQEMLEDIDDPELRREFEKDFLERFSNPDVPDTDEEDEDQ